MGEEKRRSSVDHRTKNLDGHAKNSPQKQLESVVGEHDDPVAKKSLLSEKNSRFFFISLAMPCCLALSALTLLLHCHISLPNSKGNHYREGLKSHLPVNYACKFTFLRWLTRVTERKKFEPSPFFLQDVPK